MRRMAAVMIGPGRGKGAAVPEVPSDRGRVLLVEDDPLVSLLAGELIAEAGFAVVPATSGGVALAELAKGGAFVLAVVDLGLPDMDGEVLVRRLRADVPHLPIIVATGYGPAEVEGLFAHIPGVSLMHKPYDSATLRALLERLPSQGA